MATTTTYSKTNNYGLNLYGDNDPADLRDGYNDSMDTIDDTLGKHLNRIETLESADTHDAAVLKALAGDNTVDAAAASKAKWDKAATDAAANAANLGALDAGTPATAAASKARWDKAATDSTKNTSALAALGTATENAAAASKVKWDKAATDVAAVMEHLSSNQYEDGFLVTFGDSYADNTQNRTWSYQLAQMFPRLTWKNYAKSGAGYNVGNIPTFLQQVQNCINDTSIASEKVKVAVIAGGRNDILEYSAAVSKSQEVVETMANAFPNAIIVTAPMLWDSSVLPVNSLQKYSGFVNGAKNIGAFSPRIVVADSAFVWGKGATNWYPSGDIHPNENGAKAIAKYLYTACHDAYVGRYEYLTANFGDMSVDFILQKGQITASGQGSIPTIGQGHGGQLAQWCYPRQNVWTWCVAAGNTTKPKLGFIQPNGVWGFFNPTTEDQGNASFSAAYMA